MPWASVFNNVLLPAQAQETFPVEKARSRVVAALDPRRLEGLRPRFSRVNCRAHAHARLDRARARLRAATSADGRAVAALDEITPIQAQQRSVAAMAGAAHDRGVSSPTRCSKSAITCRSRVRGDGGAGPGPRFYRAENRRGRIRRDQNFPHFGGIRRILPPRLGKRSRKP